MFHANAVTFHIHKRKAIYMDLVVKVITKMYLIVTKFWIKLHFLVIL